MPNYKRELIEYRLAVAKEKIHSAKILLDDGSYKDSVGRSYYAMFSAVRYWQMMKLIFRSMQE